MFIYKNVTFEYEEFLGIAMNARFQKSERNERGYFAINIVFILLCIYLNMILI